MDNTKTALLDLVGAKEEETKPTTTDTTAVMMRMMAEQYAAMEAKVAQYEAALTEIEEAVGV
nr:MAG TPA: hypothetical protein [Caudoviricetes sp.]